MRFGRVDSPLKCSQTPCFSEHESLAKWFCIQFLHADVICFHTCDTGMAMWHVALVQQWVWPTHGASSDLGCQDPPALLPLLCVWAVFAWWGGRLDRWGQLERQGQAGVQVTPWVSSVRREFQPIDPWRLSANKCGGWHTGVSHNSSLLWLVVNMDGWVNARTWQRVGQTERLGLGLQREVQSTYLIPEVLVPPRNQAG